MKKVTQMYVVRLTGKEITLLIAALTQSHVRGFLSAKELTSLIERLMDAGRIR